MIVRLPSYCCVTCITPSVGCVSQYGELNVIPVTKGKEA